MNLTVNLDEGYLSLHESHSPNTNHHQPPFRIAVRNTKLYSKMRVASIRALGNKL